MMWCRDFQIDTLSSIWHCFSFGVCGCVSVFRMWICAQNILGGLSHVLSALCNVGMVEELCSDAQPWCLVRYCASVGAKGQRHFHICVEISLYYVLSPPPPLPSLYGHISPSLSRTLVFFVKCMPFPFHLGW